MTDYSKPSERPTSCQSPISTGDVPPNTLVTPANAQEISKRLQTYPAIVHAAFISAFLLPIAFLPYFAARRHIVGLRRQVQSLESHARLLREDLDSAISHQRSTISELHHLRGITRTISERTNEFREQVNRQEADRSVSLEEMRTDLQKLLEDRKHTRTQAASLHGLGTSLADVAAFMQEVELEFGLNRYEDSQQYRIERLRSAALRIQSATKVQFEDPEITGNDSESSQPQTERRDS